MLGEGGGAGKVARSKRLGPSADLAHPGLAHRSLDRQLRPPRALTPQWRARGEGRGGGHRALSYCCPGGLGGDTRPLLRTSSAVPVCCPSPLCPLPPALFCSHFWGAHSWSEPTGARMSPTSGWPCSPACILGWPRGTLSDVLSSATLPPVSHLLLPFSFAAPNLPAPTPRLSSPRKHPGNCHRVWGHIVASEGP